jgi:hypothetical protein
MATTKVKGGNVKQLASNSYIVTGNTHKQGGIKLGRAEVEDDEVIVENRDNTTSIFSDNLGYAKVAKQLATQKGEYEAEIIKTDKDIRKLTDKNKGSTDRIIKDTLARNTQVKSLAINKNLSEISTIDDSLEYLVQIQELEKQAKGLNNNENEHGFGDWLLGGLEIVGGGVLLATGIGGIAGVGLMAAGAATIKSGIDSDKAAEQAAKEQEENLSIAEKQLEYNKTLAEQQRQDSINNMKAYTAATDKIFANYKPISMKYATMKNGGTLPSSLLNIPKGNYKLGRTSLNNSIDNDENIVTARTNSTTTTTTPNYSITPDSSYAPSGVEMDIDPAVYTQLKKTPVDQDAVDAAAKEKTIADREAAYKKVIDDKAAAEKAATDKAVVDEAAKKATIQENPFVKSTAYDYTALGIDTGKLATINGSTYAANQINLDKVYTNDSVSTGKYENAELSNIDLDTIDLAKTEKANAQLMNRGNINLATSEDINTTTINSDQIAKGETNNVNVSTTTPTLAKTNLTQVGYDVTAQQAAIRASQAANNSTIMGNTSNSAVARSLAMQNNIQAGLSEAQVLENKTNQENVQRAANTDRLNNTEQLNANIQNTASQFNASATNQVNLTNESNKLNVSLANASAENSRVGFNASAQNTTNQFNTTAKNNIALANTQTQLQMESSDTNAKNTMEQFNVNAINEANILNTNTKNAAIASNVNAANENSQFNSQNEANMSLANANITNENNQFNINAKNQVLALNQSAINEANQFNQSAKQTANTYNATTKNNAIASNINAANTQRQTNAANKTNVSMANADAINDINMNIYNQDVAQNTGMLYKQIEVANNTILKYGGKVTSLKQPAFAKFGYGGIINQYYENTRNSSDQYYTNLLAAKNKYYDFMTQKYQSSADSNKALATNIISTGMQMMMYNQMKNTSIGNNGGNSLFGNNGNTEFNANTYEQQTGWKQTAIPYNVKNNMTEIPIPYANQSNKKYSYKGW